MMRGEVPFWRWLVGICTLAVAAGVMGCSGGTGTAKLLTTDKLSDAYSRVTVACAGTSCADREVSCG